MSNVGNTHRRWLAAVALGLLALASTAARAVETRVVQWRFDNLSFWERPGGMGALGASNASGSFEIVVEGEAVTVRNAVFNWFPSGPLSGAAAPTGFGVNFTGEDCYSDLCGGWGIEVAGDLTQRASTLPVIGGGFNYTDGHYDWYYGNFAPGATSFVTQVSYVTNVPEPSSAAMLAAGLVALSVMGAMRRRRV